MSISFNWTENMVAEFIQTKLHIQESASFDLIEQFKTSKQPKIEWEIMAYRFKPTETVIHNSSKSFQATVGDNPDYEIYSVKRLSDSEVFSIGDEMALYGETKKIIGFETMFNKHMMACHSESGSFNIIYAKKVEAFLFTTEDMESVYDGDKVVLLSTDNWIISNPVTAPKNPSKGDHNQFKYFSTKEKAEEYKIRHQSLLSLQDILDALNTDRRSIEQSNDWDILLQKAKDKLNLK